MEFSIDSDEQRAGQRLMAGFDGTALNDDLRFLIDTLKIGGLILFSRNISDPEQVRSLCESLQNYAKACGQPPLFIAVDQEGGQVARLREPFFTRFPGNPAMKKESDAVHFARVTAGELKAVGVNMNMAPVLDAAPCNIQSIMAGRAFRGDPGTVSAMGITVITQLQDNGVMAVGKHFPGIGRTVSDSHLDMPVFDANLTDLLAYDLLPFEAAVRHGVAGIMLSHILYRKADPEWPASLSVRIARDLLRDHIRFGGIVITDDLDMGAVRRHYDIRTAVRQILAADIDITLICHKGPNIENAFEEILKGLKDSEIFRSEGEESLKRILTLKRRYLGSDAVSQDRDPQLRG